MTKLAIYRDNTAYSQFLAPALAARNDFETKVFAVGTPETHVTSWIKENADHIRSMDKVFTDNTCCEAGEKVPSKTRPENKNGCIWWDVKNNFGRIGPDFKVAAQKAVTGETNGDTIAKIVRLMLEKETPTKVYVVSEHMEDHDLFGLGHPENKKDDERLQQLLREVTGLPVYYLHIDDYGVDTYVNVTPEDNVWVFIDRHFKGSKSKRRAYGNIPKTFKLFEVPIENLIGDALKLGITLDAEAYAKAVSDIVAGW